MTVATLLGRTELLQWALDASDLSPCSKYDDLKDGLVFLALFERVFPTLVDPGLVRSQRGGTPRNPKANWDALKQGMQSAGLPLSVCDRKGVAAGHQRPCYNMLVMLYFLSRLVQSQDFSADFAHPIDEALAAFLQSPASVECLARHSAMAYRMPGGPVTAAASPQLSGASAGRAGGGPFSQGGGGGSLMMVPSYGNSLTASQSEANASARRPRSATTTTAGAAVRGGNEAPGRSMSPSHPASPSRTAAKSAAAAEQRRRLATTGWPDTELETRGEARMLQLLGELDAMKSALALCEAEKNFERERCLMLTEQTRALCEHDLAGLRIAAAQSRVSSTLSHNQEMVRLRHECQAQLDRCLAALSATQASLVDEHEATALIPQLRQQTVAQQSVIHQLKEQLEQERATTAAVHHDFQELSNSVSNLLNGFRSMATTLPHDLPTNVDGLSDGERAALAMKVRELVAETNTAKQTAARKSEEVNMLMKRVEGQNDAAARSDLVLERDLFIRRLQRELDAARDALDYHRAASARQLFASGASDGAADAGAELLRPPAVVAHSTTIRSAPADEPCGTLLRCIEGANSLNQETKDELLRCFWGAASAFAALQYRLAHSSASVRTLNQDLTDALRQCAMHKFAAEKALTDASRSSARVSEEMARQSSQESSALRLELQLLRSEMHTLKQDAQLSAQRSQQLSQSLFTDFEKHLMELRSSLQANQRVASQLKHRCDLYQQLVDAVYKAHDRVAQPSERQLSESRATSLVSQLQQQAQDSTHHHLQLDAASQHQHDVDMQKTREQIKTLLADLRTSRAEIDVRDERCRELQLALDTARQEAERDREARRIAESEGIEAKREWAQHGKEITAASADMDALSHQWARERQEMEQYIVDVISFVQGRTEGSKLPPPPARQPPGGAPGSGSSSFRPRSFTSTVPGGANPAASSSASPAAAAAAADPSGKASSHAATAPPPQPALLHPSTPGAFLPPPFSPMKMPPSPPPGTTNPAGSIGSATTFGTNFASHADVGGGGSSDGTALMPHHSHQHGTAAAAGFPGGQPTAAGVPFTRGPPSAAGGSNSSAASGAAGAPRGGVLSAEELERRKAEILAKYGVRA